MEDTLITLLKTFGYDVFRQGSLAKDESYPNTFITFWNNQEIEHSAYDDNTSIIEYDFDVNVYSTNPSEAYNLLKEIKVLLKSNNWIIKEIGYDLMSDEITHIGRGMNVCILEQLQIERSN